MTDTTHAGTTAVRREPRRRRLRRFTRRDRIVIALMIGVPVLLDLGLIWGPAIASVVFSFTNASGALPVKFVGSDNYHFMTTVDPEFWPAVQHNIIWLLVFILVASPLGMLLAVLLDRNIRGSRIYQSIFFLPVMLSLALIGIIWDLVYTPHGGLLVSLLGNADTGTPDVIGHANTAIWGVLVEATWRQAGYVMVLYLAGLKSVDPSLREAAMIDGANGRQTFFRVVFPVLAPINAVILVVTVIESLRAFDLVYITNHGTNGLEMLSAMITQQITGPGNKIGYGSAIGVVLLVISLVPITAFLVAQFRKENET